MDELAAICNTYRNSPRKITVEEDSKLNEPCLIADALKATLELPSNESPVVKTRVILERPCKVAVVAFWSRDRPATGWLLVSSGCRIRPLPRMVADCVACTLERANWSLLVSAETLARPSTSLSVSELIREVPRIAPTAVEVILDTPGVVWACVAVIRDLASCAWLTVTEILDRPSWPLSVDALMLAMPITACAWIAVRREIPKMARLSVEVILDRPSCVLVSTTWTRPLPSWPLFTKTVTLARPS